RCGVCAEAAGLALVHGEREEPFDFLPRKREGLPLRPESRGILRRHPVNDSTSNGSYGATSRQGTQYRWEIHQVTNSRHQLGPCGTCGTEECARSCIVAALSASTGPGVYA